MKRQRRSGNVSGWNKAMLAATLAAVAGWALYAVHLARGLSRPLTLLALLLQLPYLILWIIDLAGGTRKRKKDKKTVK